MYIVWIRKATGLLFLVSGIAAVWYAARVSYAQIRYERLKYGEPDITLEQAHLKAQALHTIYPHNYHLSEWVANKAWYDHGDADIARYWTDIILVQNPHRLEMRWLDTVLVGRDNPAEAARLWEAYSDNVFWNRWVMAGRVYWFALAGHIETAERYMAILQRIPGDHSWAEAALYAARASAFR